MTNPYHDELGRFSSANGMKEAVSRLASSGNVSDYLKLREEYETASKPQTAEPRSPWAPPLVEKKPFTKDEALLHKLLSDYGVNPRVAEARIREESGVERLQECKTIQQASEVLSWLGVDEYEAETAAYDLMERK